MNSEIGEMRTSNIVQLKGIIGDAYLINRIQFYREYTDISFVHTRTQYNKNLCRIDEEMRVVFSYEKIRIRQRIILNVEATNVERPCNQRNLSYSFL